MKKTLCLLTIILAFVVHAFGQEIVTNFKSGINLALMEKTIPPIATNDFELETFLIQHLKSNKLDRAIVDKQNKVIFGYKLEIITKGDKFEVVFESDENPLAGMKQFEDFERKSMQKIPGTLTVKDGDVIVIDILENPKTNGKIQDLIKVTRELYASGYFSELEEPKNFSLSDVSFQLSEFKVFLNDELLEERPRSLISEFVSFYIKGLGTFVLSPFENGTYGLIKIGFIKNEEIVIKHEGKTIRIESKLAVLGKPGKWNLWGKFLPETEKQKQDEAEGNRIWNSIGKTGKNPVRFITSQRKNLETFFEPSKGFVKRRRNVLSFDN